VVENQLERRGKEEKSERKEDNGGDQLRDKMK